MPRVLLLLFIIAINSLLSTAYAVTFYGENYCNQPGYTCHTVRGGESWESLFSNPRERDIVMRINRRNVPLERGIVIAIPKNLSELSLYDVSPFPEKRETGGQKLIIADLGKLAWAAYNGSGNLILWGPLSSAKGWCGDEHQACNTPTGDYRVVAKEGYNCISKKFPMPTGGAAMPYCMYFHDGYALHGSFEVPGYNASHGCVRMFINDARWLNQNFVSVGTRVIVKPE